LHDIDRDGRVVFADNFAQNLDSANATGFRSDRSWVDLPVTPGSLSRFVGVGRDAAYLADRIEEDLISAPTSEPTRLAV
jgi:hypothetical protein